MSRMLSSSSEMRSAGLTEKKDEPEPVAPILKEAEPFRIGPDLERVLRVHQEVPVSPGPPIGVPALAHSPGKTATEQTFFPSEDPLAAAEKAEGDAPSDPLAGHGGPLAPVLCGDAIARDYQALVEAARQVLPGPPGAGVRIVDPLSHPCIRVTSSS